MTTRPTYDELLDLLDDVSAIAQNVLPFSKQSTTHQEYEHRSDKIDSARELCDRLLRPETEQD
jgi:hypothetical protein